jgi:hypothetical protein
MVIKTFVDASWVFPLHDDMNADQFVYPIAHDVQAANPNGLFGEAISPLALDVATIPTNTETDLSRLLAELTDQLGANPQDPGNQLGDSAINTPASDLSNTDHQASQVHVALIDDPEEGPLSIDQVSSADAVNGQANISLGNQLSGFANNTPESDLANSDHQAIQSLAALIDALGEGPHSTGIQVSSATNQLVQDALIGQANLQNQPSQWPGALVDDLAAALWHHGSPVGSTTDTTVNDMSANLTDHGLTSLINTFFDDLGSGPANLQHDFWQFINTFIHDLNLSVCDNNSGDHNSGQASSTPLDNLGTHDSSESHLSGISPLHDWAT